MSRPRGKLGADMLRSLFPVRRAIPFLLLALLTSAACAPKPTSIRVSAHKMTIFGLKRGGVAKAEVLDGKGMPIPGAIVTWESSKSNIATVDGNGIVKTVAAGKSIVTAKHAELSATIAVEVVDVASVAISPLRTTLMGRKGATTTFTAEPKDSAGKAVDAKPVWTSTNPAAATIDASGVATAVSEGRTGIVASFGEVSSPADLTVLFRELTSFEVTPPTIIIKAGDTQKLNVVVKDADGNVIDEVAVVWSSDQPKCALAVNGVVKALSAGNVKILASCGPKAAEVSVIVLP
jgi:trimeric autotransporter adhesin